MQHIPDRLVIENPETGEKLFDTKDYSPSNGGKVSNEQGSGQTIEVDLGTGTKIRVTVNPADKVPDPDTAFNYVLIVNGAKPPTRGGINRLDTKGK